MKSQDIPLASDSAATATQTAVSNSRLLTLKIALARPRLDAAACAFWTAPDLRERMPRFFQVLYTIVRGGLETMAFAASRAEKLAAAGDRVALQLAAYFRCHIEEEKDHEAWLLDDMQACGFDVAAVRSRMVCGPVASLLGAQMFWAGQAHPVSFLGYLLAVEANPPTRAHLAAIRESTGYPAEAFRCMQEHADADIAHADELRALLDGLPLSARDQELIALSGFETIEALARTFEDLTYTPLRNEAL